MAPTELKTRTYDDKNGDRKMFRFTPVTWVAIDAMAKARGMTWLEWIDHIPDTGNNRHGDVREAVITHLLLIKTWKPSKPDEPDFNDAPLLGFMEQMNDKQLKADLAGDTVVVESSINFGGFTLRAGLRDHEDCIWIENHRRDMSHVAIPLPNWQARMAHAATAGGAGA